MAFVISCPIRQHSLKYSVVPLTKYIFNNKSRSSNFIDKANIFPLITEFDPRVSKGEEIDVPTYMCVCVCGVHFHVTVKAIHLESLRK